MTVRGSWTAAGVCAVCVCAACGAWVEPPELPRPFPVESPVRAAARPLPPLRVDEVVVLPGEPGPVAMAAAPEQRLITFTASNAPVREILPMIAQEAGVSLIMDPLVDARVSFHFADMPALDALHEVARQAGLQVTERVPGMRVPFEPRTVFYLPKANVNQLDAASIAARFDVSAELAEFIVLSRIR